MANPRNPERTPSLPATPRRERERPDERAETRSTPSKARRNRGRTRVRERDISDVRQLSPVQREIVFQVGQFRTVAVEDFAKHLAKLPGDSPTRSIRALKELGLVRSHYLLTHGTREVGKKRARSTDHPAPHTRAPRLEVIVLTHKGASWLRANGYDETTAGKLYPGLAKAREAQHDARLYDMAQSAIEKLRAQGATILSVTPDSTLKAALYAKRAELMDGTRTHEQAHRDAATMMNIPMRDGKYLIPDVRIEYEMPDGSRSSIDLELVTDTYRKSHIAAKQGAGFKTYTMEKGGGSVWDEDWMSRSMSR